MIVIAAIFLGLFSYNVAGRNKGWVLLLTSLPFLVPEVLFLLCWRRGDCRKPKFVRKVSGRWPSLFLSGQISVLSLGLWCFP